MREIRTSGSWRGEVFLPYSTGVFLLGLTYIFGLISGISAFFLSNSRHPILPINWIRCYFMSELTDLKMDSGTPVA
jgi:hypothetical protein